MVKWFHILDYPQVTQRSEEWYGVRQKYVTGSDFAGIIPHESNYLAHYLDYFNIDLTEFLQHKSKYGASNKTVREWYWSRLKSKTTTSPTQSNNDTRAQMDLHFTSATSHGIVFEDVVANIVGQKYDRFIKPLGLIICPHDVHCAVSPDGILCGESGEAKSLELKCVTSRKVTTDHIPFDYFMQTEFAAWQLGCRYGVYCETDMMRVSDAYWHAHCHDASSKAFLLKEHCHQFGLVLFDTNDNRYVMPNQFVRSPDQFLRWRSVKLRERPHLITVYYKINAIQLLEIPVRSNFAELFAPLIEKYHAQLMSYTKHPEQFDVDFPKRAAIIKSEAYEVTKKRKKPVWLCEYAGDIIRALKK